MVTNAREVSVDVLGKVLHQGAYSNIALDHAFSSADLKEEDTGLVTEIIYGTLKYLLAIDKIIEKNSSIALKKIEEDVLNILRISIYQMKYLDRIPPYAVLNEAVNLTKKKSRGASGFVNGVLRGYLRTQDEKMEFGSNMEKDSFNFSFPVWMIELFKEQYGKAYKKILAGLNERPVITYRVNTLKMTREEALERLLELGYDARETAISPYGIEVKGGKSVVSNPLFQQGVLTVQDESSMLVAPLLVEENRNYMDLCSAPGGKTTHIAELSGDEAEVHAFDIYESKVKLIEENKERLGLKSIQVEINDGLNYLSSYSESANVLLDAPCSGLGIIRKKPEIKYTKNLKELNELVKIQRALLETAAGYVPSGGILLYSTCTLNKMENEENIRWFLENHPEFTPVPVELGEQDHFQYTEEGFLTILPGKTMDGFFISRVRKK
ncbi:16S rRNA (cytosine(967)-C(5))-methyltransferase RsmB [Proteiniclasticum sp. C24MP]|uniref:16S rRNA (cytosine(967)-C(5))-methyltransferase RsmB n=1 Tax=Proteiniclasticum sp. C24MP TaxID=3374101 RepID=UPI003754DF63